MDPRKYRAMHQNIILLNISFSEREKEYYYTVCGTTGKQYTLTISEIETELQCSCSCPDHTQRKNKCKHIYYILYNIFENPENKKKFEEIQEMRISKIKGLDDVCSICLDSIQNGLKYDLCQNCYRCIHRDCFSEWRKKCKHNRCIFCKVDFFKLK